METILSTRDLAKQFHYPEKEAGLGGSIRSLLWPRTRTVDAVKGVTFQVESGELLAFIGPNGAGKSTMIKMLTGILHPTSGEARVLGFVPWQDRQALAYRIGAVFGQRSQLWVHLPARDSFRLLARIYEVPDDEYARRLQELVELFDLGEIMGVPVRKLSLGQRMRCEIAASLIHSPEVIFLDEPTIGLDVIAKEKIRELILSANSQAGTTIFLTSHDAGDIEKLCRRVVIVDRGQILLDTTVQSLKRSDHFRVRTIGLRTDRAIEGFAMDGVEVLKQKGTGMKLRVDGSRVPVESVLQRLMELGRIEDITVRAPSLEEIIARIYREKGLPEPPVAPEVTEQEAEEQEES